MRIMFGLFLLILVLLECCWASGEYAGLEVYANAGPLLFAGRDLPGPSRVCLWVSSGSEFGFTCGPKCGPASLGLGASFGPADVGAALMYLNLDLRLNLNFQGFFWESVNLYQKGRGEKDDALYFRHVLGYQNFLLGFVAENLVTLKEKTEAQLYWGPYVQLGKMVIFSNNKLCLAVNLLNVRQYWVAWLADF